KVTLRGTTVHCVASMSDSSAFTLTRLRSQVSGHMIVDSSLSNPILKMYDWRGPAATGAAVTIDGLANGQLVSATDSFLVATRVGAMTAWALPSQTATPPSPYTATGKPILKADYPGFKSVSSDSAVAPEGSVGFTYHLYPNWKAGTIVRGPNAGLAFV